MSLTKHMESLKLQRDDLRRRIEEVEKALGGYSSLGNLHMALANVEYEINELASGD